jgi:hypothetical protein
MSTMRRRVDEGANLFESDNDMVREHNSDDLEGHSGTTKKYRTHLI